MRLKNFDYLSTCMRHLMVSSAVHTEASDEQLCGWDYIGWGESEISWIFLNMARQNLSLIVQHALFFGFRNLTWHFSQAWFWTALSKWKTDSAFKFEKDMLFRCLCTEICYYTVDNSGHCCDISYRVITPENVGPLQWWEGPKACCLHPYPGQV